MCIRDSSLTVVNLKRGRTLSLRSLEYTSLTSEPSLVSSLAATFCAGKDRVDRAETAALCRSAEEAAADIDRCQNRRGIRKKPY